MISIFKYFTQSIKKVIFYIFGLIFIFASLSFVTISLFYMFSNVNTSLENVRDKGNYSNVVLNKNYNNDDVEYDYKSYIKTPETKSMFSSLYTYDKSLPETSTTGRFTTYNNVIFPYKPTDFTRSDINIKDNIGAAPYDDEYLSRYKTRKLSMIKAGGTVVPNQNGLEKTITNNVNTWRGLGYNLKDNTGNNALDPNNLIFDTDSSGKPKLRGYFENGNITNNLIISYGIYQPIDRNFDSLKTNGIITKPNISLFNNKPTSVNLNLANELRDSIALYGDFLYALEENTVLENINTYKVNLLAVDSEGNSLLKGINLYVYDQIKKIINDPKDPSYKYKDYLSNFITSYLPLKDSWINSYMSANSLTKEETIDNFLSNYASKLANEFKEFVNKYKDQFIYDYLQKNLTFNINGQIDEDKSFTFYDREAQKNFIVSSKEKSIFNNLFIESGVMPKEAHNFFNYQKAFEILSLNDTSNMNSINFNESIYNFSQFLLNLDLNKPEIENDNYPIEIIGNINASDKKMLISIANEFVRNYEEKKEFDIRLIIKLFSYLNIGQSLNNDFRKLEVDFNYKNNFNSTDLVNRLSFSINYPQNYQTVVTSKYLSTANKKILPYFNEDNPVESLSYGNNLNSQEFKDWIKNLPDVYKIEIESLPFIISGTGISPDMVFPIASIANPIPDPINDVLTYVNDASYSAILRRLPSNNEISYFSFKLKNNITDFVNYLNTDLSSIMNGQSDKVAFEVDKKNFNNQLVWLRYSFPTIIISFISIISIVLTILFVILLIYLVYIIIKTWIEKSKVQLAIIRANGFSIKKITLGMSFISLVVGFCGSVIGYLLSFFFQHILFSIISPFIFIPTNFFSFSFLTFIVLMIIIVFTMTIFIYINLKILFKKPISSILQQDIERKNNYFSVFLNKSFSKAKVGFKLKNSLLFINIPRMIFYIVISSFCIFTIGGISSFSDKFYQAQNMTNNNKKYHYKLDLITPNEQSGLYKNQSYNQLGIVDSSKGITSFYDPIFEGQGYLPYRTEDLKVYEYNEQTNSWVHKEKDGKKLYYGNIVLPSRDLLSRLDTYYDTFRNAVFSKWLMDIQIGSINLWDLIKNYLNNEIISRVESQDQVFLNSIANDKLIGNDFKKFATKNIDGKWSLVSRNVFIDSTSLNPIFKPEFLEFIGKVYGNEELTKNDIKVSYGILPIDFNDKNIETYTYVDANIVDNRNNKNLSSHKITGINPESNFVTLHDNDNNPINDLLKEDANNIIINNNIAYKYNLKIGDKLKISVKNSYYRDTERMLGVNLNNDYVFNIVAINSSSFGNDFYISQKKANEITRLSQGGIIPSYGKSFINLPSDYIPYNGFFSNEKNPIILSKNLSFYSMIGLYGNFGSFYGNDKKTLSIFHWTVPSEYYIAFFPNNANQELLKEFILKENITNPQPNIVQKVRDYFNFQTPNNSVLASNIIKWFEVDTAVYLALNDIENYELSQELYTIFLNTFESLQIFIISILIPIILIIILIMSFTMMEEIKKIILTLKLIGYSDKNNLVTIFYIFVPIIIFSIIIGSLMVFGSMFLLQNIIFSVSEIFLTSYVNVQNLLIGIGSLILIFVFNFLFTLISYKKNRLNNIAIS